MPEPVLIHAIPGRARFDLRGIDRDSEYREEFAKWLAGIDGVRSVFHSPISGRVVMHYEPEVVSTQQIIDSWSCLESAASRPAEEIGPSEMVNGKHRPEAVPIGLVVSVGSLVALGAKQIVSGRSPLAENPLLFGASGVLAVIGGYSGFYGLASRKFSTAGVLLQTGALALGLLRENLVVLGALSLSHYLNWQRALREMPARADTPLSPEVENYSRAASRRGLLFATIALAITGNALVGLGVLLAANPRPAVASADYAWRQTELRFREKGLAVPQEGTLRSLAMTNRVLFADADMLFKADDTRVAWIVNESEKGNANHSVGWNLIVGALSDAVSSAMQELGGLTLPVGEHTVYLGDTAYMRALAVDVGALELQARRWRKSGRQVRFVACRSPSAGTSCLGLIVAPVPAFRPECEALVNAARRHGLTIAVAGNSGPIPGEWLRYLGIEVVDVSNTGVTAQRLPAPAEQAEGACTLAIVSGKATKEELAPVLRELPRIDVGQIAAFPRSVAAAKGVHQMVNEHLRITQAWNWLGVFLFIPLTAGGAFVANIVSDSLWLVFMSRAKRVSEQLTA